MEAESNIFNLVLISICVMVALTMAIIILFNVSQRKILKQAQAAYEARLNFQRQLLESNVKTQENERTRIARELHDDIGSKLNVINLNINLLKTLSDKNNSLVEVIDHIETALSSSISRTREISHTLMPPILQKFGVQSALSSLTTEINRTGTISVDLELNNEWKFDDEMKELHLYRIIQELTNNTIKHAEAKNIIISSRVDDHLLYITYKDDGIGIKNNPNEKTGLGMSNLETRINLLNANYKLESSPGNGFLYEMSIPII